MDLIFPYVYHTIYIFLLNSYIIEIMKGNGERKMNEKDKRMEIVKKVSLFIENMDVLTQFENLIRYYEHELDNNERTGNDD